MDCSLPGLPCQSPTPRACSNSCPLSQWCHPTISSSVVPLLLLPSVFPSIRVFSSESVLCFRWPKYWSFSFSISPSNEYSGLISFRIDWFNLLAVQGTPKSLLQHHSSKASILWCSAFFIACARKDDWRVDFFQQWKPSMSDMWCLVQRISHKATTQTDTKQPVVFLKVGLLMASQACVVWSGLRSIWTATIPNTYC